MSRTWAWGDDEGAAQATARSNRRDHPSGVNPCKRSANGRAAARATWVMRSCRRAGPISSPPASTSRSPLALPSARSMRALCKPSSKNRPTALPNPIWDRSLSGSPINKRGECASAVCCEVALGHQWRAQMLTATKDKARVHPASPYRTRGRL